MSKRALVVDDDVGMCEMLEAALGRRGFEVLWCTSGQDALEMLTAGVFEAVVTDLNMRGLNGLELCQRIVANRPGLPVIVLTAFGNLDTAIAAMRAGAYDFITKPVEIDVLELALERAIQHKSLREEVRRLRALAGAAPGASPLLGDSQPMQQLRQLVARFADADASVLITGESGTGKEIVAHELHRKGREGPFVPVNCAAVPPTLIESELFGHVKGAFTDAREGRTGLFVQAGRGTIFFDEISELPMSLQPKLLRALQERTIRPVGGNREVGFQARVVAASNLDLELEVEEGRFRGDLFFRFNVLHIPVPPLRERGNDVLLLAQHFLVHAAERAGKRVLGLSSAVAQRLMAYAWPGNVRELENCIERAVLLTEHEMLVTEDLPERVRQHRPVPLLIPADDPSALLPLDEVERRYIMSVLDKVGGNRTVAAKILGLHRRTLVRKLKRYGLASETEPET